MEPPRPWSVSCSLVTAAGKEQSAGFGSQVLWPWAFLGEKLPRREQEARQTVQLKVCLTPGTLQPQNHDQSKSPPQRQLTNQEESSAPSGQSECWPQEKCTLSAVLSHGWEFMAEESFQAKLSKGFREGRIRARPQLWYHGLRVGTKKQGWGMSV